MKKTMRLLLSNIILVVVCLPGMMLVDFLPEKMGDKIWDFTIWVAGGFQKRS